VTCSSTEPVGIGLGIWVGLGLVVYLHELRLGKVDAEDEDLVVIVREDMTWRDLALCPTILSDCFQSPARNRHRSRWVHCRDKSVVEFGIISFTHNRSMPMRMVRGPVGGLCCMLQGSELQHFAALDTLKRFPC
jgi:hypothetical protein